MKADKNNTLLITAGRGYYYYGVKGEGYQIVNSYKPERNLFDRIIREICFRLPFLPKIMWYNQELKRYHPEYVIVSDTIITKHFLKWISKLYPNAQLNFVYGNMVGCAAHLLPRQVPSCYKVWTYDGFDSMKYQVSLYNISPYYKCYIRPPKEKIFDVLYVGSDKGRGDRLIAFEKKLNELGLNTKFIIVKDSRISKEKSYYQKPISYTELVELISISKSVLNIALENQQGITVRDLESLFQDVKLITTNDRIKDTDIYTPNNVFILDDHNYKEIPKFLGLPLDNMDSVKPNHTFDKYVDEITSR